MTKPNFYSIWSSIFAPNHTYKYFPCVISVVILLWNSDCVFCLYEATLIRTDINKKNNLFMFSSYLCSLLIILWETDITSTFINLTWRENILILFSGYIYLAEGFHSEFYSCKRVCSLTGLCILCLFKTGSLVGRTVLNILLCFPYSFSAAVSSQIKQPITVLHFWLKFPSFMP